MVKKRSKGVMILAWLMIIVCAYTLLSSFNFQGNFFDIYVSFPKVFNIALIAYTMLSAAIGVVAGFGILRLKDIMRKAAIVINFIDLIVGLSVLSFGINDIREYVYATVAYITPKDPTIPIYILANASFYAMVILNLASFALNLLFIFFFTRPKVKEQFR